jgi:putative solute:sodium symporter small subunit
MSEPRDDVHAIYSHWLAMRPAALWLTLVWALVTFVPPLLDVALSFEVAGASLAAWIAMLLGPLVYVALAWWYERQADRCDRERQSAQSGR